MTKAQGAPLHRVPIRLKLTAALSVPLAVLFLVSAIEVVAASNEASEIREQTDLARAAIGPSGVITQLQNERRWSAVELVGGDDGASDLGVESYEDARARTDRAITALRAHVDDEGGAVSTAFRPAFDTLTALQDVRRDIDENAVVRTPQANLAFSQDVFTRYTRIIEPFFDSTTRLSLTVDDPMLRQGTELADIATRQIDTMSVLVMDLYVTALLTDGGLNTPDEIARISMLQATFARNADTMRSAAGPFARAVADRFPAELTDRLIEVVDQAIATTNVDPIALSTALDPRGRRDYADYQQAVADGITRRADSLDATARSRQRWFTLLVGVVLVVATTLTWLVSRSITRPLRSLTRQAQDVADRRLPGAVAGILDTPLGENVVVPQVAPARVRSRDEVADVADALNTVQDAALDLAVEQAVLRRNIADSFVNLGRRNQNLLGRQLDFITELETNETDPDTLANLFRLDHLATRMRRNAESLLVLAGMEPSRRWTAPVQIADVIRAALGEVEDYQRAALRTIEPATVIGAAAADLAHLLAELIENALVYSPPDRAVDIGGRHRTPGATGRLDAADGQGAYALAVVDAGTGMTAGDLAAANRRLAGVERFTVAPSTYLGHYVAGRLAARHGIRVQLDHSPGDGVAATVWLPPDVLAGEARGAARLTPARGVQAAGTPGHRRGPAVGRPVDDATRAPIWPARPAPFGGSRAARPLGRQPAGPAAHAGSAAPDGLARRVRGAQLPDTQPTAVPRPPVVRPAPSGLPPTRSAEEVYSLLARFTAGVQRGRRG